VKLRLGLAALLVALLVGTVATAGSALTNGGASSPDTGDYMHINWVAAKASTSSTHRNSVIPLDVSFKAGPFPGIDFVYTDSSDQHYVVPLEFHHDDGVEPQGYSLRVPNTFANGSYKLQSIYMNGFTTTGTPAGKGQFAVHSRNQEYIGFTNGSSAPVSGPVARKYNIDFTKLDLTVKP
jgi:hypothetical protein